MHFQSDWCNRRFNNDLCPDDDALPGFKSTLDAFYQECLSLSLNVLKCLAMAMKLGEDFFEKITTRTNPQLRLIRYMEISVSLSILPLLPPNAISPMFRYYLCCLSTLPSTSPCIH
jgi:isopenicillin N synthase-like dioxygenase